MRRFHYLLLSLLSLFLVACGSREAGSGKLRVVTTATMVTDLVRVVGGEHVELTGLMGEEVDPHSYDPVFQDMQRLQSADAVFYVGLHLEGKMQESLESLARQGKTSVALADGVDEKDLLAPQEDFPGAYDPHIWGDPALWKQCALHLAEVLAEKDPAHAEDYRANAQAYAAELDALKVWSAQRIAEVPESGRVLVTSHDAFFYLGRAYGIEVRGLQGVSTESEVGLGGRSRLVDFLRQRGVKAVFGETSVNDKGIAGVAREAGVALSEEKLYSDAMGRAGDLVEFSGESYDRGTYIGMQKHNINTIVEALK